MIEKTAWTGVFEITVKNTDTGEVTKEIIKNRVMDAALDDLINSLTGVPTDLEIAYLALGTGNTPITDTDTKLDTEIFRTAPVTLPTNTATGQVETEFIALDNEAVETIEEIGIFVGSSATGSADTGKLLSRILWKKVKSGNEEINFRRVDKITRG